MKQIFLLLFLVSTTLVSAQNEKEPYNENFYFRVITEKTRLERIDSLEALLIEFGSGSTVDFEYTIKNNPQLREIKLFNPTQAHIESLSAVAGSKLEYLFIEGYDAAKLYIHAFRTVKLFSVTSENIEALHMESAAMDSLDILSIDAPKLTEWKTAPVYPVLGLIDLHGPLLTTLPFQQLPQLYQCSAYCSFNEFPAFLCDCKELTLFSFTNYKVVPVPKCLIQQLKDKGYYSDITLYNGLDGKEVKAYLSPDRKK